MDDDEVTEVLKEFLDELDEEYKEVDSEKKTLYVRCPRDSEAPRLAYVKRKSLDPSWKGMVMVDTLNGGREEYVMPEFTLLSQPHL